MCETPKLFVELREKHETCCGNSSLEHEKELPIGERVNFENGGQESEYDSSSKEEVSDSTEYEVEVNRS